MDQILSKVWNSRYGKYLLPLSFCVGNLINVMFYYLGPVSYTHLCLCRLGCLLLLRLREGVLPPAAFSPAIGHKPQKEEAFHEHKHLDLKPLRK